MWDVFLAQSSMIFLAFLWKLLTLLLTPLLLSQALYLEEEYFT
jgi:hypothetical protein